MASHLDMGARGRAMPTLSFDSDECAADQPRRNALHSRVGASADRLMSKYTLIGVAPEVLLAARPQPEVAAMRREALASRWERPSHAPSEGTPAAHSDAATDATALATREAMVTPPLPNMPPPPPRTPAWKGKRSAGARPTGHSDEKTQKRSRSPLAPLVVPPPLEGVATASADDIGLSDLYTHEF